MRPLWTFVFLGLIVLVYIAEELTGGSTSTANLIRLGANYAPLVAQGEYWRLVTANFLHIGILHIAVNAYALYILGTEMEALFGHTRFIVIYLLTGISGAVFSFMMTQGLSAGASTALFGLFGALAVFFYRQRQLLGELGRQRLISLGVTLLINVVIGLSPGSGIDNWGHLGGVLGGAILGWFLCPSYTLVTPFMNTLSTGMTPGKADLTSGQLVDSNSLPKQSLAVGLFAMGLVVLTVVARMVQQ
ncbi:MAG TPA: rhomboid family intramembrane serine protease [Anaerolineae bacterium]